MNHTESGVLSRGFNPNCLRAMLIPCGWPLANHTLQTLPSAFCHFSRVVKGNVDSVWIAPCQSHATHIAFSFSRFFGAVEGNIASVEPFGVHTPQTLRSVVRSTSVPVHILGWFGHVWTTVEERREDEHKTGGRYSLDELHVYNACCVARREIFGDASVSFGNRVAYAHATPDMMKQLPDNYMCPFKPDMSHA